MRTQKPDSLRNVRTSRMKGGAYSSGPSTREAERIESEEESGGWEIIEVSSSEEWEWEEMEYDGLGCEEVVHSELFGGEAMWGRDAGLGEAGQSASYTSTLSGDVRLSRVGRFKTLEGPVDKKLRFEERGIEQEREILQLMSGVEEVPRSSVRKRRVDSAGGDVVSLGRDVSGETWAGLLLGVRAMNGL